MDGLRLDIQKPGYCDGSNVQRLFYNGWKKKHYLSNIFVFSPDGKIRQASANSPGTYHNSKTAYESGIYNNLNELFYRTGGKIVVDTAFDGHRLSLIKTSSTDLQGIEYHRNV